MVIRGVPQERCEVHHNWFCKHTAAERAVRASENTTVRDNVYGDSPEAAR